MKALTPEYRYHLKVAALPLIALLFLWRADIMAIVAVTVGVLVLVGIVGGLIWINRDLKREAALDKIECTQDGHLSLSGVTSDLQELEKQASELLTATAQMNCFLAVINVVDCMDGLRAFLQNLPKADDAASPIPITNEMFYLVKVAELRPHLRQKLLYEYQRRTGSLAYKVGDKKPLLTLPELMRRLDSAERDQFLAFCGSLNDPTKMPASYFEERRQFLAAAHGAGEGVQTNAA